MKLLDNDHLKEELKQRDLSGDLICPFCYEEDFDKIGLKIHLDYCAPYREIEV